jgi:MFS family permease
MSHELPSDIGTEDLAGAGNVFRNRNFVYLWTAQVLSQLASNMVLAALLVVVFGATGSNTVNALLILSFLVPAVLFSTLGGVLVERGDARLIMLATNLVRAGGVVLFIFVAASKETANVPLIFAINLVVASATAFFAPAELTSIPRIVERRHLMAANSLFILTINATFAIGFALFGPLLLTTVGAVAVYVVVALMFGLAALAILPLPSVVAAERPRTEATAGQAFRALIDELREGIAFVRRHGEISWSLTYLGVAASLIGVIGAIGPGFARDILRLSEENFLFIVGPAGVGAVIGVLFLNSYGRGGPKRLYIDIGLVAMGVTLLALAVVRPISSLLVPALGPIEDAIPTLAPLTGVVGVVIVIGIFAGVEYAFVAIPSQTALQEELPVEVRGRTFGILNTLLSIASFLPVIAAPAAADVLNIAFDGAGIPIVMAVLGVGVLVAGVASWRRNARAGLHAHDLSQPVGAADPEPPPAQDEQ